MKYAAFFFTFLSFSAPSFASDTLMDILYKDQRQNHLETLESQRIQYEERSQAYLEGLYSAAYDMMADPALADLAYTPHLEDVKVPPRPDSAGLSVNIDKTKTLETPSGTKFLSGGQLDVPVTTP